ncbi:MAG: DsrE family protein [Acidithiobacillus sp.]|nr:DsrE family protein [Acidithiobacillus sp.]
MSKLAVVLLSDMNEPVKVEMAMRFALVAQQERLLDDLRFYFFGPGVRVPGQILESGSELEKVLQQLLDSGMTTVACVYNARQMGEAEHLQKAEIEARAIGPELTRLVADGYQVMTF